MEEEAGLLACQLHQMQTLLCVLCPPHSSLACPRTDLCTCSLAHQELLAPTNTTLHSFLDAASAWDAVNSASTEPRPSLISFVTSDARVEMLAYK